MYGAMEPNLLHNIIVVDVFFFFYSNFYPIIWVGTYLMCRHLMLMTSQVKKTE